MALNNNKETVGFMGNPNVKASGIATKFSKEQVMEYIKCSEDPCYFIEKYCKVVSLDDGIVPFALRPYQKRIIEAVHNNRFTISMLFRQSGKALPLDTEIPTPSGFKKLRDIRIGSVIYGADGKETTVIAESDPKRLEMYRITFDTNESVVACKDHLWTITKSHNGHKETLNTKELVKLIRNGETLYIENTKCVEYPHKETLLTPSRIGELIANGFFDNNDKLFIEDYANLSKQQRLELLKTLFSLKGVKKESYHITLQNGIARFVLSLLTSLGIKVFVQVNHAKTTLSFKSFEGGGQRVIKSIVRVNDEMGKCIQVDNEDKLFLCTRNYIPTHNSTVMAGYLLWYATFNELKTAVLLANKQSTAIEIFGRVQLMYELLPDWLKQGVVEWNKKSIKFENGSRIFTAASSPSAVRGSSCVSGDTEVCVSINGEVVVDTIDNLFELDYGNPLFDIRIMTEDGFKKFGGFVYQGEREVCHLTFNDGKTLTCTNDHRIRVDNNAPTFVEAQYLSEGDILYGGKVVTKKAEEGGKIAVYDAFEVEDTHTYITNGIVSHNCNLLMLDEFAFLKDKLADEFIASVFPTLSSSKESKLVITSTPNGLNSFHKIWKEAQEGINDFVAVRGWWQELHSEEWAKKQYNLLGDVKYKAEIECEFLGSSHTLIDGAKIGKLPITKPLSTANNVSVYEFPNKNSKYVCTVDTSRGRGRDYSAFVIFDVTQMPYKIVCTFKDNKISSLEYPSILNAIGRKYNNAVMVIENNDLGESVANSLWFDFEYEEVIWTNKYEISSSGTIGVRTTRKVKQRGCSNIKELVEKDQLVINDERIVEEFGVYVLSSSGLYAASNENINDDLCSCLFLFGWFTDQPYFEEMTNLKPNSEMTKSFAESLNDYLPMGFKLDGTEDYNPHVNTRLTTEQVDLLL